MNRHSIGLIGVFVLGACGGDAAGPTGDRLTRAEAMLIAGEVQARGEETATSSRPAPGDVTIASDPITIDHDLQLTLPCPLGGQLQQSWKASGEFDLRAGSYELDIEGMQKHLGCAYKHEGVTITIDGDPDLELVAHSSGLNHRPSGFHTLEINGAFKWSASDGRSGTCPIAFGAVTDWEAKKRTVDGIVCGHAIKETTTWS